MNLGASVDPRSAQRLAAAAEMIRELDEFVAALTIDGPHDFQRTICEMEAQVIRSVDPFADSPLIVATVRGRQLSYRMSLTQKLAESTGGKPIAGPRT